MDQGNNGSGGGDDSIDGSSPPPDKQIALAGEELEEYCKKHGLCNLCARTRTHKRVFRLVKKNQWQPLTIQNKDDGVYIVYKGYCVQPGCFTLNQAKRLLGELGPTTVLLNTAASGSNDTDDNNPQQQGQNNGGAHSDDDEDLEAKATTTAGDSTTEGESLSGSDRSKSKRSFGSRLLRRRNKKNNDSDDASVRSWKSNKGRKKGGSSFDSMSGMSGLSGFSGGSSGSSKRSGSSSSRSRSGRSVSSEIRRDDDDVSVASAMTSSSKVRMSLQELLKSHAGTILDLSSTRLHHVHITELVNSLTVANSLQSLILENCKLNDNEVEVIGNGLANTVGIAPISRLSLRSNRIGNRGAVSLEPWLKNASHLEKLDVSKNQIGSRGATAILHAFRDNPNCALRMINFAHNEIWDPDDGSFFATNATLELVNLEGNFIHDEGIEAIAKGLRANHRRTKLVKLYLGWNGIGDEGCMQLAYMLESNTSLETLGLGENDISSTGARALLSSLANNNTLREITGLYHNQIDRKFIIAAIKRLLVSHTGEGEEAGVPFKPNGDNMTSILESSMSAMETLAEPLGSKLPPPEEMSESSLDWADKLYAPGDAVESHGVQLGKFDEPREQKRNVEEAAPQATTTTTRQQTKPRPLVESRPEMSRKALTFATMPAPKTNKDRIMMFQSAPLAYFNKATCMHHAVPLSDFDHEIAVLKNSLKEAEKFDATIELDVEPGYLDRVRDFFDLGTARVLHLSCYGHPDQLAFENGAGYIQTLSVDELKSIIANSPTQLQLVVVNSFHSGRIGKAFLDAGVPHVICCHHTEVFRDKASNGFLKNLYRALAANKSLKQAFYLAQEALRVEEISKHVDRYALLPRKGEEDSYHDVPIFFTEEVSDEGIEMDFEEGEPIDVLPHLPKHFIGREVDIYEVLEALRVDDVVRVGGPKGSGKTAVVSAVCRYIRTRKNLFNYDNVFWIPAVHGVHAQEDTLFGDLCELTLKMLLDKDMTLDDDAMECQERIEIELEGSRTILAIDGRKFESELASQNLEQFIGQLLNSVAEVKILLLTSSGEGSSFVGEGEEDDTIVLGPIDFKPAALLFGELSRFITANGCPAAQAPDEFAALMVPPSVAKLQDQTKFSSSRRTELMSRMGHGNPASVIQAGKKMPASAFIQLIGLANTPEVEVDSANTLEAAISKWSSQRDRAVELKNYLRATDLEKVLGELYELRSKFPNLQDLQAKEEELQRKLTHAMSSKQYAAGNSIKREILAIKKLIMQEKRAAPNQDEQTAVDRMTDLQAQVQSIMKLAHSSFSDLDNLAPVDATSAAFTLGSAYHHCEVNIYNGSVCDFDPGNDLGAAICWTNECCDMSAHPSGPQLLDYGGPNLGKDIGSLPGITKTRWGLAKCGTGNAVIVGPGNYDDLAVHCIILAVGPISPNSDDTFAPDDEDVLHYIQIMMRSCIRSSLILAKHSQVQSVAFPTLTTKVGSATYEQTLLMGLKILVEEAKHSDLNTLDIVASSEEEASKLIAMAIEMGLVRQM